MINDEISLPLNLKRSYIYRSFGNCGITVQRKVNEQVEYLADIFYASSWGDFLALLKQKAGTK